MADNTARDVGFADFVAVLIVETLDSIVAAHTSQEERMRALDEAVRLTPEQFAATAISDQVLSAALVELFPDGKGGTSIVEGGPVPDDQALADLGISLGKADLDGEGAKARLTARGARTMASGVALHLATRQLEAMQEARGRGVPRVVVDGGTLRAKVNFTTSRASTTPAPTRPAVRGAGAAVPGSTAAIDRSRLAIFRDATLATNLVRFDTPLRAGILDSIRDVRINVLTPRTGEPEPTQRADIQGEVEIRFRTVQ